MSGRGGEKFSEAVEIKFKQTMAALKAKKDAKVATTPVTNTANDVVDSTTGSAPAKGNSSSAPAKGKKATKQ